LTKRVEVSHRNNVHFSTSYKQTRSLFGTARMAFWLAISSKGASIHWTAPIAINCGEVVNAEDKVTHIRNRYRSLELDF